MMKPMPTPPLSRARRAALLMGAAALLPGCAARPSPKLLALPPAGALGSPPASPPVEATGVLVVRRVTLPEYLLSRRVRYRADASTLDEWPGTVWAERIEVAASRELLAALRSALPGWTVCEPGCATGPNPVLLQVEFTELDLLRSSGRLRARARVTIDAGTGTPRQLPFERELATTADTPQAHAQVLAEMLRELAGAIAPALPKPR